MVQLWGRLSRNKSTSFTKIPKSNGGYQAAIIDSTLTQEVSLFQWDEEVYFKSEIQEMVKEVLKS